MCIRDSYKSRQEAGFPTPLGSAKGRGIQPPKLAVEFDPYPNYCSCSSLCTNEKYCSSCTCLLYTSDAADDLLCVDLGGRRIIKKKKQKT